MSIIPQNNFKHQKLHTRLIIKSIKQNFKNPHHRNSLYFNSCSHLRTLRHERCTPISRQPVLICICRRIPPADLVFYIPLLQTIKNIINKKNGASRFSLSSPLNPQPSLTTKVPDIAECPCPQNTLHVNECVPTLSATNSTVTD